MSAGVPIGALLLAAPANSRLPANTLGKIRSGAKNSHHVSAILESKKHNEADESPSWQPGAHSTFLWHDLFPRSSILRDYILLAVLIVLVPAALLNPFWGLLAWTWMSYFNPHEFTWGITRELPVALLIAIPTLLGLPFGRKRIPPLTRETVLVIVLWCWFAVTTLNVYLSPTFVHHLSDTMHQFGVISKILLMQLFVAVILVTTSKRLRLWYLVTAATFAFFALKSSVFGVLTGGQYSVYGPPNSMIADNNDFGLGMNMALPMFMCLSKTETSRALRWIFRTSIIMGIVAVVLTYSRGALLGLIVVLGTWALKSKYKVLGGLGLVFTLLIIFVSAPGAWITRMETIRSASQTDPSAISRLHAWEFATDLAADHPVFGGGFETFTEALFAHYSIPDTHGPHSIYFQVLAEHGFPGLLIFVTLICSCYFSCRQIIHRFGDEESLSDLAEYAKMVQLSLVAFLVSGAFLGRAYFDLFYQLVASVIILRQLSVREQIKLQDFTAMDRAHRTELVGAGGGLLTDPTSAVYE
jgi:putative inorganic carbon (HCO3(-)) transporter